MYHVRHEFFLVSKRIGLLGGTFNPVHLGHLVLAEEARERLKLNAVWFIPVAEPPLKEDPELAPAKDRLAMVRLAIAGQPAFRVDDIEMRRGGKSYTVDTLRALRARYGPRHHFVFLLGSDAARQLPEWKDYPDFLRLCHWIIAIRPGARPAKLPPGVETLDMPLLDISATNIRRRIARGRSIRYLVPEPVRAHVIRHHLFAAGSQVVG